MKYDYRKLWKILIDRKMLKKDLKEQAKITSTTLTSSNILSNKSTVADQEKLY